MKEIRGVILQPLSGSRYSWSKYNKKTDDFLEYFQNIMNNEIKNVFDVRYETKEYANYLFIPYSTKTYECFGSYLILEGKQSNRKDLPWSYILNQSFKNDFKQIVRKSDILGEAIMDGNEFKKINDGEQRKFHYKLDGISKKLTDYILNIGNKKTIIDKQVSVKNIDVKNRGVYKIGLQTNLTNTDDLLKNEKSKMTNGENAEILIFNSIKDNVDLKVLGSEILKLIPENNISEIHANIDKLIHYSKNFDTFAPFDLISTRGSEIIYIEVKSTTCSEIYFSVNEIIFASKNINNYQVKVVKNEKIYNLDIKDFIIDINENILGKSNSWSLETIKFKLDFDNI